MRIITMATFYNRATLYYNNSAVTSNIVSGEIVETLSAAKNAIPENYSQGDVITYVISLVNAGTADITGLTVTDDLGAYEYDAAQLVPLTYIDGSVRVFTNGVLQEPPASQFSTDLVITGINVPANGNTVIIYQAQVNEFASPEAGGSITNTAVIGGTAQEISVNATVTVSNEPELSICKSLSPLEVTENGELTYTFAVQNTGCAEASADDNAIITDTFDPILSDLKVALNGKALEEDTGYSYDPLTGEFATAAGVFTVPAATYAQDAASGIWTVTPGTSVLTVTGTV